MDASSLVSRSALIGSGCWLLSSLPVNVPLFLSSMLTLRLFPYITDKRRLAGVFLAISITVTFFPLARLAPLINRDDMTVKSGIEFSALVGNLIALTMGLLGISVSWAELVHDTFHPQVSFGIMVFEIAAFIPYFTDLAMIGKMANTGTAFIPAFYTPSESQVWFVGAMGMMGAATFCLSLFGSYALLATALYAYHASTAESPEPVQKYNAGYFRGRLIFYSAVMWIAGFAQLALGAFVIQNFGNGPLPAPVTVAMFMVNFPEICVFVGLVYMLNAMYGIYRGLNQQTDSYFAMTMWFQLLCTIILMVLVQTSYAPGGAMAQATPTLASLTLGVSLTPIFLDSMARSMPEEFTVDYYFTDKKNEDVDLEEALMTKTVDEDFPTPETTEIDF